jgi:cyanate permease
MKNKRWLIVLVVYLASVVVILNQYKVPPLITGLMVEFGVSAAEAGWFMSVFALMGVVLALPAALLLRFSGPKGSGAIGLICIIFGCWVGGAATSSSLLITGRVIEGAGLSLMSVVAPAVIAMYFSPAEIGLPMGIWATWYPVGSALAYNISQPVTEFFGSWRGNWWVGGFFAVFALILYLAFAQSPQDLRKGRASDSHGPQEKSWGGFVAKGLQNKNIWLLGTSFLFMMIGSLGFLTWAPTYFVEAFGYARDTANAYASMGFLWSAPGGIFAGWLLTKTNCRYSLLVGCAILSMVIYTVGFLMPQSILMPYLAIVGFVTGFTCALVFAMVPLVMKNRSFTGIGMGIIALMQSVANLIAMPLFGAITAGGTWDAAVLPSGIILLLGLAFATGLAKREDDSSLLLKKHTL